MIRPNYSLRILVRNGYIISKENDFPADIVVRYFLGHIMVYYLLHNNNLREIYSIVL